MELIAIPWSGAGCYVTPQRPPTAPGDTGTSVCMLVGGIAAWEWRDAGYASLLLKLAAVCMLASIPHHC